MPTAYTAKVMDGKITELKDYILLCVRNMGPLSHMRDESLDSEIRLREASNFHIEQLHRIEQLLFEIIHKTDEEIQEEIDRKHEEKLLKQKEAIKSLEVKEKRYLDMIKKVKDWDVSFSELSELKRFALSQLHDSLNVDCGSGVKDYTAKENTKPSVSEYKTNMIREYLTEIKYHAESQIKEEGTVNRANAWIKQLLVELNKEEK